MPKRGYVDTFLERRQSRAWNSHHTDAFGYSILKNIKDQVRHRGTPLLNINRYANERLE